MDGILHRKKNIYIYILDTAKKEQTRKNLFFSEGEG